MEAGFAERYASAGDTQSAKEEKVQGIAGQAGAYALYNRGQSVEEKDIVRRMIDEVYDEKVWEHTLKIFDNVEKTGKTG